MAASTPIDKTDPRWIAWEKYEQSEEYANTRKWAQFAEHVDGSLWAAFIEGWQQASAAHAKESGDDK